MQHRDMHVTTTPHFTNILLIICQSHIPDKPAALAPNMTFTNMLGFCVRHIISKNVCITYEIFTSPNNSTHGHSRGGLAK